MTTDLRARLVDALGRSGRPSSDYDLNPGIKPPGTGLRDAAVLIGVIAERESLILTKRASGLKHHPGQIAFPGGKIDPDDTDANAAALREAEEEIALASCDVDLLGQLAPHETVTGFQVTPVLALVASDFRARAEPSEVSEVFEVPLEHVLNPANYLVESRRWRGMPRYYFTVPWGPYYIWGATARMLRALADQVADGAD